MVQLSGLCASTEAGDGSIPGQGAKIPQTTKVHPKNLKKKITVHLQVLLSPLSSEIFLLNQEDAARVRSMNSLFCCKSHQQNTSITPGPSLYFIASVRVRVWVCSVAQSGPTFCDPMDCSLTGSAVHGIF